MTGYYYITVQRREPIPYVTISLILINFAVFFCEEIWYDIIYLGAMYPMLIMEGQTLYTLITSMFLHANLIHILLNMWALWLFGRKVELELGALKFSLLYFVAGIIAGLIDAAFTVAFFPELAYIPCVGASGAIFGVMAAFGMLFPRERLIFFISLIPVQVNAWGGILLMVLIQVVYAFLMPYGGIAYMAHVGGFLGGAIMTYLYTHVKLKLRKEEEEYYTIPVY